MVPPQHISIELRNQTGKSSFSCPNTKKNPMKTENICQLLVPSFPSDRIQTNAQQHALLPKGLSKFETQQAKRRKRHLPFGNRASFTTVKNPPEAAVVWPVGVSILTYFLCVPTSFVQCFAKALSFGVAKTLFSYGPVCSRWT